MSELGQLTAGQGHDWPDVGILRGNGLKVVASPSYEGLFGMLAQSRIDDFPRAVAESWAERDACPALPLAVESSLALR